LVAAFPSSDDANAKMGMDFLLNVVAIPTAVEPAWDAAARHIDAVGLEDLGRFFDYWDPDGGSRSEAAASESYVGRLRAELRTELESVRRSLDEGSREHAVFDFQGYRFLATGGASVGSVPTELYDAISRLHAVGALEVAGFVTVSVDGPDDAKS
jgi:hypothetical protein